MIEFYGLESAMADRERSQSQMASGYVASDYFVQLGQQIRDLYLDLTSSGENQIESAPEAAIANNEVQAQRGTPGVAGGGGGARPNVQADQENRPVNAERPDRIAGARENAQSGQLADGSTEDKKAQGETTGPASRNSNTTTGDSSSRSPT